MRQYTLILLYAATILAMVGCEKIDLNSSLTDIEQTITYTSTVEATKATITDQDALEEYGIFNIATFLTDDSDSHYYTDQVSYSNSVWSSGRTRYWPTSYNLNMFAYSPMESFITVDNSTDYSNYSLAYTCPSDIDKQVDLLVKTLSNQSPSSDNGGAVNLKFDHALSGIKFNVQIGSESNVTLNSIDINYVNIDKVRTYNFATQTWGASESTYFESDDNSTTLTVNQTETTSSGTVTFDDIDNQLLIIPQEVSSSESNPHYISIQISYTLNSGQDDNKTAVTTGVMPLPAPSGSTKYEMSKIYTYSIIINGETITFGDITIDDQDEPVAAYGNIDLGLITVYKSAEDIGYADTDETTAQYYFTTAERVKNLLNDDVRDFVVVGSMGANSAEGQNTLGNGKLGYYGSESSPFYIGAKLAGLGFTDDDLFSIDLRGTYDYPRFADANNDNSQATAVSDDLIGDDEPILIAGLFSEIDWIDEVILPHGIAAIGNHAFDDCDALRYIDLADVRHIEIGSFQNCGSLEIVDNGALTRVHENGFDKCISLTTIDLSNIKEIDDYGFADCANLTNVNLQYLDDIGKHAFSGCSNLTLQIDTEIPGFTQVEDYAFNGCYKLGENGSKIDLELATKVGDHAFANCQHIELSSGELTELTEVGEYGLSGCTMLGYNQELTIPNLELVGDGGFFDSENVNIVDGLDNLTIINNYAFQNCTSLTGYSADATDKSLSLLDVTEVCRYGLFNTAITNVAFSDKLTTIGKSAFNGCSALTTLSGLSKVTSVGIYAFASCNSLEELDLPLLTSDNCGGGFFSSCTSLKTINLPLLTVNDVSWVEENEDGSTTGYESYIIKMISSSLTDIESIDLRSLIVEIPEWHINDKLNLKYANFASATSVAKGGFAGCSALTTLDLSSATTIGDYAFQGCTALEELILSSVEGSFGGWELFYTKDEEGTAIPNENLMYVDLSSVDEINSGTFAYCQNIVSIDLGGTTTIGQQPFMYCNNLTKLNLSSLVDDDKINGGEEGLLWNFYNYENCELWLSDEQYPEDGVTWQGKTWKAIYKASDTSNPFSLK